MRFHTRLILLFSVTLLTVVFLTASLLAWSSRNAMYESTSRDGELVSLLLARSAGFAEQIPKEVEDALGQQMVAAANIAAEFVAAGERADMTAAELTTRLEEIVKRTALNEIWITDEKGHAYLHSVPDVDFTFSPDSALQPQASQFWPLLTGEKTTVIQDMRLREIDNKTYKYVGVTGVDKPRIVQVGLDATKIEDLRHRIGLEFMVKNLLAGGDINAIWVISPEMKTIAYGSILGGDINPQPTPHEAKILQQVFDKQETRSILGKNQITIMTPVPSSAGRTIGVSLVRLPLDHMNQSLQRQVYIAIIIAVGSILIGIFIAYVSARRVTNPIEKITNAAKAIQQGNFNPASLFKVAQRSDEMGQLAQVFNKMAEEVSARQEYLDALVVERTAELEIKNKEIEQTHQQLHSELMVAQSMQIAILPTDFPVHPNYEVFGKMVPAKEMGGDFYDLFRIDDEWLGLAIADVSGKGMPAAFFMAVSRTELQSIAASGAAPGEVLSQTNQNLCSENPLELFVTVFYGLVNVKTGQFIYSNGGHNPPYILRSDGSCEALPLTDDMVLGVMPDLLYNDNQVTLQPGDTLVMFTDGVTESFNPQDEEYGEERLIETLKSAKTVSAKEQLENIYTSVSKFADNREQSDDITCLLFNFHPDSGDVESTQVVTLTNDLAELEKLAETVENFCDTHEIPPALCFQINLVLDELITNTISYSYDEGVSGTITIQLSINSDLVTILLVDNGRQYNPLDAPPPDLDTEIDEREVGGLGVHFVREYMDTIDYEYAENKNQLILTKQVTPQEDQGE